MTARTDGARATKPMRSQRFLSIFAFVLLVPMLASCAARTGRLESEPLDPLEPMNRGISWFNDRADLYVLEPTAKGWDYIIPEPAQRSISNFFDNLRYPANFVNTLLQGHFEETAITSGRFTLNTSIGLFGLFDPATHMGLPKPFEDFGQTLGVWKIPAGPYLVLPLLGPSSLRDAVGLAGDAFLNIRTYVLPFWATTALGAIDVLNFRARVIEDIVSARKASLDYYAFIRNAYLQRRIALIRGERTAVSTDEDLYQFDYELEYDDEE